MIKWAIARTGLASYWTGVEFNADTDQARLYESLPEAMAHAGMGQCGPLHEEFRDVECVPFGLKYVPVGSPVPVPA